MDGENKNLPFLIRSNFQIGYDHSKRRSAVISECDCEERLMVRRSSYVRTDDDSPSGNTSHFRLGRSRETMLLRGAEAI